MDGQSQDNKETDTPKKKVDQNRNDRFVWDGGEIDIDKEVPNDEVIDKEGTSDTSAKTYGEPPPITDIDQKDTI